MTVERVYDKRDPYFREEPKNKSTRFDLHAAIEEGLEICRKEFEAGDKSAAMRAIYQSLKWQELPPDWASNYYVKAYEENISTYKKESWDKVLGRPYPKNMQIQAARQKQQLMHSVWLFIRLKYQNEFKLDKRGKKKRVSIGESLFESAGKEFNISKSTASV